MCLRIKFCIIFRVYELSSKNFKKTLYTVMQYVSEIDSNL
jgi:hypothetical protein